MTFATLLRSLPLPTFAVAAFLLTGCKDEPTPHAIDVKSDPRIKRVEMGAPAEAIEKKGKNASP